MEKSLDSNNIVVVVLMDFPQMFDGIPHDLPVANLHVYGLSRHAITLLYPYLKRRKKVI